MEHIFIHYYIAELPCIKFNESFTDIFPDEKKYLDFIIISYFNYL